MAFIIQLGTTTKRKNSTLIPTLTGASVTVLLKDDTSLVRPIFELRMATNGMSQYDDIFSYNYCYCEKFHRYYFITDIIMETAAVANIRCEVDVLATFRAEILATKAFIVRAESKTDISITDGMLGCCNPAQVTTVETPMNCGAPMVDGMFYYTFNCGGGVGQTARMSKEQLTALGDRLYSDATIDRIKDSLFNPASCLGGCVWTPFTAMGAGDVVFKAGSETYGTFGKASDFEESDITITPYIKYKTTLPSGEQTAMSDFRNFPPYADYSLFLPVVGMVQLDARKIICDGNATPTINIKVNVCPRSGDISYIVTNHHGDLLLDAAGNVSYPIQVSSLAASGFNLASYVLGATGMVVGALMGNAGVMSAGAGALVHTSSELYNYQSTVRGNLGGLAINILQTFKIRCITSNRDSSDEPGNIITTVGMPLQEAHVLGTMKGLVSCRGAYVSCKATAEEHLMISTLLNGGSSLYESYGGVIIE